MIELYELEKASEIMTQVPEQEVIAVLRELGIDKEIAKAVIDLNLLNLAFYSLEKRNISEILKL